MRHKGTTNRFTVGEPVRDREDQQRTGRIASSNARTLRADVTWDAGGTTTELWCNLWKANEPTGAPMPFPRVR